VESPDVARIRTIKPSFWTDEKIGCLSRETRLTFLGLISAMADDDGRLKGNARIVRGAVYPFDDDITAAEVETHLSQLADAGRIVRYRIAGDDFIQIANWYRHQKIDRPSRSLFPAPEGEQISDSSNVRRALDESTSNVRRSFALEVEGSGGVVEGNAPAAPARSDAAVSVENPDADVEGVRSLFPKVSESLPPTAGADPLREFMARVSNPRPYLAEMAGSLEGANGILITAAELRSALTDWLANGETPNLRRFRGYLRGAVPKQVPNGNGGHRKPPTHAEKVRATRDALLRGTG
jgi:hypothetical protein